MRTFQSYVVGVLLAFAGTACELNKPHYLDVVAADAGATTDPVVSNPVTTPADPADPTDEPVDPIDEPVAPPPDENGTPWVHRLIALGVMEVGKPLNFQIRIEDDGGIEHCDLAINGKVKLLMNLFDEAEVSAVSPKRGWAKLSYTPSEAGDYTFQVSCFDSDGLWVESPEINVGVVPAPVTVSDTTPPSVTYIYPLGNGSSDLRDPIRVTARYSDAKGVTGCDVIANGVTYPGVTDGNGLFDTTFVPSAVGSYALAVRCVDAAGNATTSDARTINVYSVSGLGAARASTASAVVGTVFTFTASIEPRTTMASCTFLLDSVPVPGALIAAGAVSASVLINTAGTHTAQFSCVDNAAKTHASGTVTVTVTPDVTAPTVGAVAHAPAGAILVGVPVAFTSNVSVESPMPTCTLSLLNSAVATTTVAANVSATGVVTASVGAYGGEDTVTVTCSDAVGNAASASAALTVAIPPDVTLPLVTALTWSPLGDLVPLAPYVFSANASDNVGVTGCTFTLAGGSPVPVLPIAGIVTVNVASYNSEASATLSCVDAAGNVGSMTVPLTVAVPPPPPTP